jgi:hypothetical protein
VGIVRWFDNTGEEVVEVMLAVMLVVMLVVMLAVMLAPKIIWKKQVKIYTQAS